MQQNEEFNLFWADQLADKIITRKKFKYVDKEIPKFEEYVVKTSASISGVLHIGRLSDTIRGATLYRALKEVGVKPRLVWVAEDMDPLRKIPEGVPKTFEKYIGVAVTDIPDPENCHESYAEHHKSKYFEVLDQFVFVEMQKYSTREEYKKGSFKPYIKKIMHLTKEVREIQNKYRTNPLKANWSPWTPICEKCGKIVTAKVTGFEDDGKIRYVCKDYVFETTTAKGCNHKGLDDPMKGNGKLLWKSEWAAEWAFWRICCEGAGKEYNVPNSAFWINAEIAEKILDFPAPEPMFYEHLMIDGVKMSASLGNVVYPKYWIEVATPQLLSFFYNKRIMKTRSFSWKDLPQLYDEYDEAAKIYFNEKKLDNEKENNHVKRLYELSNNEKIEQPIEMSFGHAAMVSQIFSAKEGIVTSLKKTGQYKKEVEEELLARIKKANLWLQKYAPESERFVLQEKFDGTLSEKQKEAVKMIAKSLRDKKWDSKTLFEEFYRISKEISLEPKELFKAGYLVLLNKEKGPKLAPFILALGDKAQRLLEQVT